MIRVCREYVSNCELSPVSQSITSTLRTLHHGTRQFSVLTGNYARIDTRGQDLAALLISRGLARAKGTLAILPDGTRARDHMEHLQKIEADAKTRHDGIWATSKQAYK